LDWVVEVDVERVILGCYYFADVSEDRLLVVKDFRGLDAMPWFWKTLDACTEGQRQTLKP
jgi:hypothetical protein